MGNRGLRSIGWAPNVGQMLDDGVKVYAACSRCGCQKAVNLGDIIAAKGRDYSLFNRRARRCKMLSGCAGYNYFCTDRWGGIITPFRDAETSARWLSEPHHERK
jgi:hypothetical protein